MRHAKRNAFSSLPPPIHLSTGLEYTGRSGKCQQRIPGQNVGLFCRKI
jgi:hypothetical protein